MRLIFRAAACALALAACGQNETPKPAEASPEMAAAHLEAVEQVTAKYQADIASRS